MRTHSILATILAAALTLPAVTRADLFQLQDGRTISGSMVRTGDTFLITADDGTTTTANLRDITRITLTGTSRDNESVDWSTFKSALARADDITTILSLHQKFLDDHPQSTHADDVRNSLAAYQQLVRQDPVKFRGRWMPSAQIPTILQQYADAAAPALRAYKSGHFDEALANAQHLLATDPQNPDALTIAGLASVYTNRLSDAQKYFTTLATIAPNNGLAWNNLAVIYSLFNHRLPALADYARTLQSLPTNRLVLDNIAAALINYTGEKDTPIYQSLARQFAQAESREETQMAAAGLYRYGATWLSPQRLTQYTQQDAQLTDNLNYIDTLSHAVLSDDAIPQLQKYQQALLAVEQSRRAFMPRIMDLGEDHTPPAPIALAPPQPLPEMPNIPQPAIGNPTTDNEPYPPVTPVYIFGADLSNLSGLVPQNSHHDHDGNRNDNGNPNGNSNRNGGSQSAQNDRSTGTQRDRSAARTSPQQIATPIQFAPFTPAGPAWSMPNPPSFSSSSSSSSSSNQSPSH